MELYNCPYDKMEVGGQELKINGSYSEVPADRSFSHIRQLVTNFFNLSQTANLWFGTGEDIVHHLFSRGTHQVHIRILFFV